MSNTIKGPFIVTGASGHLGSQVIEALLEEGAEPIRSCGTAFTPISC